MVTLQTKDTTATLVSVSRCDECHPRQVNITPAPGAKVEGTSTKRCTLATWPSTGAKVPKTRTKNLPRAVLTSWRVLSGAHRGPALHPAGKEDWFVMQQLPQRLLHDALQIRQGRGCTARASTRRGAIRGHHAADEKKTETRNRRSELAARDWQTHAVDLIGACPHVPQYPILHSHTTPRMHAPLQLTWSKRGLNPMMWVAEDSVVEFNGSELKRFLAHSEEHDLFPARQISNAKKVMYA